MKSPVPSIQNIHFMYLKKKSHILSSINELTEIITLLILYNIFVIYGYTVFMNHKFK